MYTIFLYLFRIILIFASLFLSSFAFVRKAKSYFRGRGEEKRGKMMATTRYIRSKRYEDGIAGRKCFSPSHFEIREDESERTRRTLYTPCIRSMAVITFRCHLIALRKIAPQASRPLDSNPTGTRSIRSIARNR